MNKILIKENSFEELLGVLNNYIIFVGKRITLVGGPFNYKEDNKIYYCQKIILLKN
jgi:hypothetical protein